MPRSDARSLTLEWLAGEFAVARLEATATIPPWAGELSPLISIMRSDDELSIVTLAQHVPDDVQVERGFAALRIVSPLDFGAIGILAHLTAALAEASISVFAISTYDTDYLLVPSVKRDAAHHALSAQAGVTFRVSSSP